MGVALLERPDGTSEVRCDGPEARLSVAMGLLNAATAELVGAIAATLETREWHGDGITTPEQWVALRCGVTHSRARRLVALAQGLGERPAAAAAFGEGSLSEDQVALVCTHVDAAHDAEVTALARRCTVEQLRRILPSVVPPVPAPAPDVDRAAPAGEEGDAGAGLGDTPGRRQVAFGTGEDGRWWARLVLPPDEGALVEKALEAARDQLFRGLGGAPSHDCVGWSDALVHLAEAALGNIEGTGRLPSERFQVVVHVDADDPERARLHLGPVLSASLRRYLGCDATARTVLERAGTPMHVFARRRTVDERLRTLVEHRDQRCRVPGCGRRRRLHVHHLLHHEDGGATVPENLCCLCPAHHRMHHLGRLGIDGDPTTPDGLRFTDHLGRPIRGPDPHPPNGPLPRGGRHHGAGRTPVGPAPRRTARHALDHLELSARLDAGTQASAWVGVRLGAQDETAPPGASRRLAHGETRRQGGAGHRRSERHRGGHRRAARRGRRGGPRHRHPGRAG